MPSLVKTRERRRVRTRAPITLTEVVRAEAAALIPGRLSANEWRRRLWHIAPGFLPFFLWAIPHPDPVAGWVNALLIGETLLVVCGALYFRQTFRRATERTGLGSILGYGGTILPVLLLFPAQVELGLTTLAILAFGDGCATLVGMHVHGSRLPWNNRKTWSGFTAFLACATPMAAIVYWGEARPGVPFATAFLISGIAVLVAALAESLPSRINDNIRVSLAAALTLIAMQGLIVGW